MLDARTGIDSSKVAFQGTEVEDETLYKSVSKAAVLSMVFSLMGILAWFSPNLLFLPVLGIVFGIVAIRNLRLYPAELSGSIVAWMGTIISFILFFCFTTLHTIVYLTEVPPGFERVSFGLLTTSTSAEDFPPPSAIQLNGKKVFIKGYIHPTSISSSSAKTFVFVPDMATCCFGTQPRLTSMIEVRIVNDKYASKDIRIHSVAGTLEVHPYIKHVEGLQGVFYQLEAEHFQ